MLGLRTFQRATRAPAFRQTLQRRFASAEQGPSGIGAQGVDGAAMKNAFNSERAAVKEHAAATSGLGIFHALTRLFSFLITDLWRKLSIYIVIPAIAIAGANAYRLWVEHWEHKSHEPPLEEQPEYPYQNIRTKNFFWGDGDKGSLGRVVVWETGVGRGWGWETGKSSAFDYRKSLSATLFWNPNVNKHNNVETLLSRDDNRPTIYTRPSHLLNRSELSSTPSPPQKRSTTLSSPLSSRNLRIRLPVLPPRLLRHLLRHTHALLPLKSRAHKPVTQVLLIVAALAFPDFIPLRRPEARTIRREHFVDQDDLVGCRGLRRSRGPLGKKGELAGERGGVTKQKKSTHHPINPQTNLLHLPRHLLAHNLPRLSRGNILIVRALLGLRGRSPNRAFQLLTLPQPRRHGDPMHGARALVLGPGGAGDVAAHDGLEGQDRVLADLHSAVLEGGTEGAGDAGGKGDEPVCGELVVGFFRKKKGKWESCCLREGKGKGGKGKGVLEVGKGRMFAHARNVFVKDFRQTLLSETTNKGGTTYIVENYIVGGDTVRGDKEQGIVVEFVDFPDFARSDFLEAVGLEVDLVLVVLGEMLTDPKLKVSRDWLGRKSRLGNFDSEAEVARVCESIFTYLSPCHLPNAPEHSLADCHLRKRGGAVTHEMMRCLDALHHALMGTSSSSCLHDDAIRACIGFLVERQV
ncbi:hypothetical protein KC348_g3 [Hortaea werneckii]|nr:hypothetical protein KC348_g3 [Hortaea werneckii]